jgi:hypothetical protein
MGPHLQLGLSVALLFGWSTAHAAPRHEHKPAKELAGAWAVDDDQDDQADKPFHRKAKPVKDHEEPKAAADNAVDAVDADTVASPIHDAHFDGPVEPRVRHAGRAKASDDDDGEPVHHRARFKGAGNAHLAAADDGDERAAPIVAAPVDRPAADEVVTAKVDGAPERGWQLAIGPYVWASSVQATVALGPLSTGVNIGFVSLARHAQYGAEAVAQARHGRFAITGDIMYGAASVTSTANLGPVMAGLTGNASGLILDSQAGYQIVGNEDALFSLEARSGLRYERTTVSAGASLAGVMVTTPDFVESGMDLVTGLRGVLRPGRRFLFSAMFDVGVAGASASTWSATVDASLHLSSSMLLTAGWRTLTVERSNVTLQLSGPRVAVQWLF